MNKAKKAGNNLQNVMIKSFYDSAQVSHHSYPINLNILVVVACAAVCQKDGMNDALEFGVILRIAWFVKFKKKPNITENIASIA